MTFPFEQRLAERSRAIRSLICIGLDPDPAKIPRHLRNTPNPQLAFNQAIIDATADIACAYKPNSAYYEAQGSTGMDALQKTVAYAQSRGVPVVLDAKRGDIGSTAAQYATFAFSWVGADAVTLNPYMGKDALEPFFADKERYVFALVRTSNPSSGEFQDCRLENGDPVYLAVAKHIVDWRTAHHPCGMVVGATYPEPLAAVRALASEPWILVPGIGRQGGDIGKTLTAGLSPQHDGMIINSSRGIIYASSGTDFAEAARHKALELRNQINEEYPPKGIFPT